MKFRFSIFLKLLAFILPLVCLPIAILGYFSIQAAEERVNRLVRQEQMVKVEGAAEKIKSIFNNCRLDLQTIAGLPVLEDYHIARNFRLLAETEFNYENIQRLFKDFITRSAYYYQIRFIGPKGTEWISEKSAEIVTAAGSAENVAFFDKARAMAPGNIYTSDISYSNRRKGYIMQWAVAFYTSWREFGGWVVIDLDYEKIMRLVNDIRVGEKGYAFLVDSQGRNTAHPVYPPYQLAIDTYPESSLKELVGEMITGQSSWKTYVHENVEKVAAFTPIAGLGWSLAVTLPVDELGKEASAIKLRVIQVAGIVLVFAVLGVSLLSYYLMRPVRELVRATNRIAEGDLSQEIPIQSKDELGDLTRSFNRMVKNLARIQSELVRSEKLISLGRLSAGVAHEIRNPLNAMKGAIVHIQRRRHGDPLIAEYTQLVSEEIDRLSNFVTDFLYLAKQSKPKLFPTDLNQLILSIESLFQKQAAELNIRLNNQLDPHLPAIAVDPSQMDQVFVNVLINAMDALPDGGDITFSSFLVKERDNVSGSDQVRIEIRDNGTGIAKDRIKSIFDPFFSTKESGTGLGLPISLGIVESHHGSMQVLPRQEKGVKVIIELPVNLDPSSRETDRAPSE